MDQDLPLEERLALTTLELLTGGLGGNTAGVDVEGERSPFVARLGVLAGEDSSIPRPSGEVTLYRSGDVESNPADRIAASSSCCVGSWIGELRVCEGKRCV